MCACQNHTQSWLLLAKLYNEAPHLFLGATKYQAVEVLTMGTRVWGDSQVARKHWQGASLLTTWGWGGTSRNTHLCPYVRVSSPFPSLPPRWLRSQAESAVNLTSNPSTQSNGFLHSDLTSMRRLPNVPDENPAIIWGAGKNVVIHWAHRQAVHCIFMSKHIQGLAAERQRAEREAHGHTHTHKDGAESEPSSS